MTLRKTHACVGAIQSSLPYRKRTDLLRPPIAAMPNKTTALKNQEVVHSKTLKIESLTH